ncbi:MAG: protein translocase subunit SecF [Chloroflexi bacterium]|nr:protein translocase subunit SecF [Chloroflexota bacterium]
MFLFNLVERRKYYFLFSGLIITAGIVTLIISTVTTGAPLQLSIDFTGGTLMSLQFREAVEEQEIRDVLDEFDLDDIIVQRLSALEEVDYPEDSRWSFRTDVLLTDNQYAVVLNTLDAQVGAVDRDLSTNVTDRQTEGGGIVIVHFEDSADEAEIQSALDSVLFNEVELDYQQLQTETTEYPEDSRWSVRTDELTPEEVTTIEDRLEEEVAPLDRAATTVSQVSESVGREVTRAAFLATLAAAAVVLGFIWFAFRKVPHPVRYGASAIVAMLHDIMIMVSVMSIMGMLLDWQVDALFLTALLTVVGFSVQDSIVVFDRIRENIPRRRGESYELIVNRSILETIHRSLATQLNAMFVMVAIILFGGETIRQFVTILLVGLVSGTYSSIFIAVPLLVAWSKGEIPFLRQAEDDE